MTKLPRIYEHIQLSRYGIHLIVGLSGHLWLLDHSPGRRCWTFAPQTLAGASLLLALVMLAMAATGVASNLPVDSTTFED